MKKALILLITLLSQTSFAGDFSINGIAFNDASIYTQHREYHGSGYSVACELKIFLTKNKSIFSKSVISKNGRKATCSDLSSEAIARFVSQDSSNVLSSLLVNLGDRRWVQFGQDMDSGSSDHQLACKLYVDQIQDTALSNLCYQVSHVHGSFSTRE
jgi:hypothetical protein